MLVDRYPLVWGVYDTKRRDTDRHHMNMHKIEDEWGEEGRDMFMNESGEILRYAAKVARSGSDFRTAMTAVGEIRDYRLAHPGRGIPTNSAIMARDWKRLCQHVDEEEITWSTRVRNRRISLQAPISSVRPAGNQATAHLVLLSVASPRPSQKRQGRRARPGKQGNDCFPTRSAPELCWSYPSRSGRKKLSSHLFRCLITTYDTEEGDEMRMALLS